MKKIALTENEIAHLRNIYEAELEAAKSRIASLTGVLSKLGELKQSHELIVNKLLEDKVVVAKKVEKKVTKKPGKRGRPPKAKVQPLTNEKPSKEIKATPKTTTSKAKAIVTKTKKTTALKPKVAKPKVVKTEKKKTVVKVEKPKVEKNKTIKPKVEKVQAPASENKPKVVVKKLAPKKKAKTPAKSAKKIKKTAKINWNEFIVDTIKSSNKFIPSSELTKVALVKFNIPAADEKKTSASLATALTKLYKTEKKVSSIKNTTGKGNLYGMPEWIGENGEAIPEMK